MKKDNKFEVPLLRVKNLHHTYSRAIALKGIDFNLYCGEIHAVTGDHRSGKSTLAGILSGAIPKQQGTIEINGQDVGSLTPRTAILHHIGAAYQEPLLISKMTVLENIYSGCMPSFFISNKDIAKLTEDCHKLFNKFGIEIDPFATVESLSEGNQQIVELVRVLARGTEILILDEVSRRLKPSELEKTFEILRTVRDSGRGIIYVTSMIDEVIRIADRVTVLKDGYRRSTDNIRNIDRSRLISLAYNFALTTAEHQADRNKLLLLSRYDAALMQDLPVGILILDQNHTIALANSAAEKAFNTSKKIDPGLSFNDLLENGMIEQKDTILISVQNRDTKSWDKLRMRDGKIVKLKVFPVYEEDGSYSGSAVLAEDITIDYVTKEYLSRAEKIASTAELAAGVAHEINNPLGIVKNYLAFLKLSPRNADENAVLDAMDKELGRIVEIVSSLLSFSRVQQRPRKEVDLRQMMDELLLFIDHKLSAKHITVERFYDSGIKPVQGYENRLRQLFLNLITNSIDAVLEQGTIEIQISPSIDGGFMAVSIKDNGCGIPQELAGEIFKPFYTTKMTKTNTGLGLSICQHIAEIHQGVITFESETGQGTSFTVKLPL